MWGLCESLKVLVLLLVIEELSAKRHHNDKCKFPRQWKGRWYQNGQELNIRSRAIDGKGQCEQLQGDYFLLKNKEDDCYQCMLIIERHRNVLQYRESFCSQQKHSLEKLCRQITVEESMFTLIREPATTINCPLLDAYYFSYKTSHSPTCSTSESYVKPCVGSEKLQLHFSHCDEKTPLHGADLDLECLAAWKDGSEMFMYGKLSGSPITSKEESYRCFKYEFGYNNRWSMTMSLDSTCRGLFTATLGPFMLELHKDVEGWPSPVCAQPDWLMRRAWRDLKGEKVLSLSGESSSLLVFEKTQAAGLVLAAEYRCIDVLKKKDDSWVMMTFLTAGCTAQFKCMKIKLLHSSVMVLEFADVETRAQGDQCTSGVEYTESLLILPNTETVKACPYPGVYPSTEPCADNLLIGCGNDTSITHRTSCPGQNSLSIQCKLFWEEGDTTHIIGHPSSTHSSQLACYSLKKRGGNRVEWRSDPRCVLLNSRHFTLADVSTFSAKSEHCATSKDKSHENEVIKWSHTPVPNQKRFHRQKPGDREGGMVARQPGDQEEQDTIVMETPVVEIQFYGDNNDDWLTYKTNANDMEYSSQHKGRSQQNPIDNDNNNKVVAEQRPNSDYSTSSGSTRSSCYSIFTKVVLLSVFVVAIK